MCSRSKAFPQKNYAAHFRVKIRHCFSDGARWHSHSHSLATARVLGFAIGAPVHISQPFYQLSAEMH